MRTATVRVHRVTIERWSEEDEDGNVRDFTHTLHDVGTEERPIKPTLRPTKLARAKARYAGQSLREPTGAARVWVLTEDGTVQLARLQEPVRPRHVFRIVEQFAGRGQGLNGAAFDASQHVRVSP